MNTKTETAAEVLAEMRQQTRDGWTSDGRLCQLADRLERALSAQSPSYDALLLIAQSTAGALERAGVTDCDDPGEAIDVLRERWERKLSAQGEAGPAAYCRACQAVGMSNCGQFNECSGATCITCHRPLNPAPARVTEEKRALLMDAIKDALTRWPDSFPAIHFMSAAIGPFEPITADDIAWAVAALEDGRHD